eukprot:scaffold156983_cov21-Tisochrysis_lutea.AAC.3
MELCRKKFRTDKPQAVVTAAAACMQALNMPGFCPLWDGSGLQSNSSCELHSYNRSQKKKQLSLTKEGGRAALIGAPKTALLAVHQYLIQWEGGLRALAQWDRKACSFHSRVLAGSKPSALRLCFKELDVEQHVAHQHENVRDILAQGPCLPCLHCTTVVFPRARAQVHSSLPSPQGELYFTVNEHPSMERHAQRSGVCHISRPGSFASMPPLKVNLGPLRGNEIARMLNC